MKKILTLNVVAKEWWDGANGNSYFSARVEVNGETIYLPFQYGYESAYEQATNEALKKAGYEVGEFNIRRYCRENNIPATFQKKENQYQRDVKSWGKIG